MTKNQLINQLVSLKTDLKYLKKDLQFRLEGNERYFALSEVESFTDYWKRIS